MGNPNTIKPGALLRTLREQQNLTVEDISEKTLISLGKLKLLEEDRYHDVGIDLFVSGYIKKYSYIVGADSDQLIADFKSLNNVPTDDALSTDIVDGAALRNGVTDDSKITDKSHAKTDARSEDIIYPGDKINPLAKIIPMVFVVVVLIAIWGAISFFMRDDVPPNMDMPGEEAIEARSDETGVPQGSELTLDNSVAGHSVDSIVTDSIVADSADTDVIDLPISESEDASSLGDVAPPPTSIPDTIAPSLTPVSDSTSAVNIVQSDLVFSFSDDCWVSVKDANGESLFAQLQSSSDNLQLSGIAPFDIQLGNARVATLRVNGEPFSIPVRSGRKTLRFTVTP